MDVAKCTNSCPKDVVPDTGSNKKNRRTSRSLVPESSAFGKLSSSSLTTAQAPHVCDTHTPTHTPTAIPSWTGGTAARTGAGEGALGLGRRPAAAQQGPQQRLPLPKPTQDRVSRVCKHRRLTATRQHRDTHESTRYSSKNSMVERPSRLGPFPVVACAASNAGRLHVNVSTAL